MQEMQATIDRQKREIDRLRLANTPKPVEKPTADELELHPLIKFQPDQIVEEHQVSACEKIIQEESKDV